MTRATTTKVGLVLRLFVAGHGPNSQRAIANTKAICDEHCASEYELQIVDLLEDSRRALADGIIVTPTLLRLKPLPVQRLIGDLSNTAQVVLTLIGK